MAVIVPMHRCDDAQRTVTGNRPPASTAEPIACMRAPLFAAAFAVPAPATSDPVLNAPIASIVSTRLRTDSVRVRTMPDLTSSDLGKAPLT
ncbi:MAG: hypothetical protein J0H64_08650 [Actinobacteria bacterium]|nr:hypothetical protein [Actinomycetota bacterium]